MVVYAALATTKRRSCTSAHISAAKLVDVATKTVNGPSTTLLDIHDFRSKNTGLYSKLARLALNDPQGMFNITVFRQDLTIFLLGRARRPARRGALLARVRLRRVFR